MSFNFIGLYRKWRALADGQTELFRWLTWAALCVGLLAILLTFRDYGITWDEPAQDGYGHRVAKFYESLFSDDSAMYKSNLYLYGGFFDTALALIDKWFRWLPPYETRHLLTALYGLFGVLGAVKVARLLAGERAGFFAAVLLLACPGYFGQMFNNPKDIPFAVGYVWSLYYILVFLRTPPPEGRKLTRKLGLALGATLGVRIGGLLVVAFLGLATVAKCIWLQDLDKPKARQSVTSALAAVLLAYGFMLIFWPWAMVNPLIRPFAALSMMTHFIWQGTVLFDGNLLASTALPWTYLPRLLLVQMPELFFPCLVLGLGAWLSAVHMASGAGLKKETLVAYLLPWLAGVFPVVYIISAKSTLYDGYRHILFALPPLVVVGAIGINWLFDVVKPYLWLRRFTALGFTVYVLGILSTMIQLHPEEYVYFNRFIGGLAGAYQRYDLDYWGNGVPAVLRLAEAKLAGTPGLPRRIAASGHGLPVRYFCENSAVLKYVEDKSEADFSVDVLRAEGFFEPFGPTLVELRRDGVPLIIVRDLKAAH